MQRPELVISEPESFHALFDIHDVFSDLDFGAEQYTAIAFGASVHLRSRRLKENAWLRWPVGPHIIIDLIIRTLGFFFVHNDEKGPPDSAVKVDVKPKSESLSSGNPLSSIHV